MSSNNINNLKRNYLYDSWRQHIMKLKLNWRQLRDNVLPLLVATFFTVSFVSLGLWQLDRAAYKNELAESFLAESAHERVMGAMSVETYQPIKSVGHFVSERQILIDNIVKNGRLGLYVITPFEYSADEPLLLVNRGWIQKTANSRELPALETAGGQLEVRGKAGVLPRVGIRPGEAFEGPDSWPRVGVYPTHDEVAAELGREVLPFVLLQDPQAESNMLREWQPVQSGPATHYGYALQWLAMAAAVLAVTFWHLRNRYLRDAAET
jgi:surfeit locus 1 family protein